MDVYLIPVNDRYELYSEQLADAAAIVDPEAPAKPGPVAAVVRRVKAAIAHAERQQQSGVPDPLPESAGWVERAKRRSMCWIAEKLAEWRLLWRIRKESNATLIFPDDVSPEEATAVMRRMLQREADRHLKWSIIDGVLFCVSGIIGLLPGPNPLAYYFGFRFVGHFLSRRGARHALDCVVWAYEPSPQLSGLRTAVSMPAVDRDRRVHEIAAALRLEHLATFFNRTAAPAA
jgi:hypothetical protein